MMMIDDDDDDDDDGIELMHVKIQHLRTGCVNPACLSFTITVFPLSSPAANTRFKPGLVSQTIH